MTIKNIEKREDSFKNESTFATILFTRNDIKMIEYFLSEAKNQFSNYHHLQTQLQTLHKGFKLTDKKMQECNLNNS